MPTTSYQLIAVNFASTGTARMSVSAAPGLQNHSTLVATGNGNSIALYLDDVSHQIVGRSISSTGALGSVATLTTIGASLDFNAAGDNQAISAARLANGNIVVVWPAGTSIYARVFDPALVPLTGELQIASPANAFARELFPDVAALPGGDFVVTWQDFLAASESHIRAGRFGATGVPITVFTVDAPTNLNDERPSIAALADGGFVIGFDRRDNAAIPTTQVYGAIYNADNSVRTPVTLIDGVGATNRDVDVVARPAGGFTFLYESLGGGTNADLSVLTSSSGTFAGFTSGTVGGTTNDHDAGLAYGPDGYGFAIFGDNFSPSDRDVRGALIAPDGTVLVASLPVTAAAGIETAGGAIWLDRTTIASRLRHYWRGTTGSRYRRRSGNPRIRYSAHHNRKRRERNARFQKRSFSKHCLCRRRQRCRFCRCHRQLPRRGSGQ